MQRSDRWFSRVVGTSAGAITAALIAAGYKAVCEDRHECRAEDHVDCIKGLLFNADAEAIARREPATADLQSSIVGSLVESLLDLVAVGPIDMVPTKAALSAAPPGLIGAFATTTLAFPIPLDPATGAPATTPPSPPFTTPGTLPGPGGTAVPPPLGTVWSTTSVATIWATAIATLPDSIGPNQPTVADLLDANPTIPNTDLTFRRLFALVELFGRYESRTFRRWFNAAIVRALVRNHAGERFGDAADYFEEQVAPADTRLGDLPADVLERWSPTLRRMMRLTRVPFSCVGSSLDTQETLVFNDEEMPGLAVADAVTMSISAPFYLFVPFPFPGKGLTPQEWEERFNAKGRRHLFKAGSPVVDGGVTSNFPFHLLWAPREPTSDGIRPYLTNEDDDYQRRKLGFQLDSREPGTARENEGLSDDGVQWLPTTEYAPDRLPRQIRNPMNVLATARNALDSWWLRDVVTRDRSLQVFIPQSPYDWVRFNFTEFEAQDLAARGYVAARDALEAAGWTDPEAPRQPDFFTMFRCLNDTGWSGATMASGEGKSPMALASWMAGGAPRPMVAFVNERRPDPADPPRNDRRLAVSPALPVPVELSATPSFVLRGDRAFGFAPGERTSRTSAAPIVQFRIRAALTAAANGELPVEDGPNDLSAFHPEARTTLGVSAWADPLLSRVLIAWVAPDGKVFLGRVEVDGNDVELAEVIPVTVGTSRRLVARGPVSITDISGSLDLALALEAQSGEPVVGSVDPSTGVFTAPQLPSERPGRGAPRYTPPTVTSVAYGRQVDQSMEKTDAHATVGWHDRGVLVTWSEDDRIHYRLLRVPELTPLIDVRVLREDLKTEGATALPAGLTQDAGFATIPMERAGFRFSQDEMQAPRANALLTWIEPDQSELRVAKVFGLHERPTTPAPATAPGAVRERDPGRAVVELPRVGRVTRTPVAGAGRGKRSGRGKTPGRGSAKASGGGKKQAGRGSAKPAGGGKKPAGRGSAARRPKRGGSG